MSDNLFGNRIKLLRKEKKLTQEELAQQLGLKGKSSIANYENGLNSPSDEIKLKMCEIFDCSIDYLMGKSKYKNIYDEIHDEIEKYGVLDVQKLIRNTPQPPISKIPVSQSDLYLLDSNPNALNEKSHLIDTYMRQNNIAYMYMCPVYGNIAAGQPNWAEECIEGRLPIDPNLMDIVNPEECYFLRVNRREYE